MNTFYGNRSKLTGIRNFVAKVGGWEGKDWVFGTDANYYIEDG